VSAEVAAQERTPSDVRTATVTDARTIAAARVVAETYWKAQKTSDLELFRSVTPHESMNVVFGWSFVRESAVRLEEGEIAPIRDDLRQSIALSKQAKESSSVSFRDAGHLEALQKAAEDSKKAAEYARRIAVRYPILGDFLQKSYWDSITPDTFVESKSYTLMTYEYIADVEFQSKAGTTLKRRVHTLLRRLIVGSYDSGWKVFFIPGS